MDRSEVVSRLKTVERALRSRGVGALFLFGSHSCDEACSTSDIDVFVDAGSDSFYDLSNFMGAYEDIVQAFPGTGIGYSTRDGLSKYIRPRVERDAVRIF